MFLTGSVRPEGCRGPHHPVDPQGSMREYPVREPCPPKCCYPDMRRSNPTCEASGTTATIWEHQSGGGLAEDEWLNASERSVVKVRHPEPAKGADRPEPKWHAGRIVDWNPRRRWRRDPPDYRAQPSHPPLPIGQQGKPHSSR